MILPMVGFCAENDQGAVTLDTSAPVTGALPMTLPEAMLLAVRNNIGLRNAYLGRVLDKYELWVSEGKFVPQGEINMGVNRGWCLPVVRER